VFDVTRRETLDHLESKWMVDFDQYRSFDQAVRLVVGNKIDLVSGTMAGGRGRGREEGEGGGRGRGGEGRGGE
jgi:Ras-related protein Rab-18